jgi:hypothetical protein
MGESIVKETMNGGTEISHWDSGLKDLVKAVEDYADATQHAERRGGLGAEDRIDEVAQSIKQRPRQSVALAFGLAFGTWPLFAWIASRTRKKSTAIGTSRSKTESAFPA